MKQPFEQRVQRATRNFLRVLDDRLANFAILEDVEDETKTYDGQPCPLGHRERYLSNRACVECAKVADAVRRKAVPA